MALTYRTPMEDIVASFEPAAQNAIASTAANGYKLLEEKNFSIANYKLNNKSKEKLSNAGIYLSPFSAVVHSHPVCKTLENYFLYSVLPNYISNKFFFVGIKSNKLNTLKLRDPRLNLIDCINRYVTSADVARYSQDFVVRRSAPHVGLKRHRMSLDGATLRDLVPHAMRKEGKHIFLHDELHYWGKQDLMTFLEVFEPEVMLATVVIPPELLIGATQSLNPWCYTFQIEGNKLLFFPDGERSEGYEQPLSGAYLLKTNEIHLLNGSIYCLDIVCSKFAHHLVCISKGQRKVNNFRCFGNFEAVGFESLKSISSLNQTYFPVSFDLVSKIYRYLMSLKKPDLQSAIAKMSQIIPDPSCNEIKFVTEFAQLVINCNGVNSIINPERLKIFFSKFYKRALPGWLSSRIKSIREVSLDDFIRDLKPLSLTIKTERLERGFIEEVFEADGFEAEGYIDVPTLLDENFKYGDKRNEVHQGHPYIGESKTELKPEPILLINRERFVHRIAVLFRNSYLNEESRVISRSSIISFISMICRKNPFFLSQVSIEVQGLEPGEFLRLLIRRIKTLLAQKMRPTFAEVGLRWFSIRGRFNTRKLCAYPDEKGASRSFIEAWKLVTNEMPNIKGSLGKLQRGWSDESVSVGAPKEIERNDVPKSDEQEPCCSMREIFDFPVLTNGFGVITSKHSLGRIVKLSKHAEGGPENSSNDYAVESWPEWLDVWAEILKIPEKFRTALVQRANGNFNGLLVEEDPIGNWCSRICMNIEGESQIAISCRKQLHMFPVLESQGVKMLQSEEVGKRIPIVAQRVSEEKLTVVFIEDGNESLKGPEGAAGQIVSRESSSETAFDCEDISRAFNEKGVTTFNLNGEIDAPIEFSDKLNNRRAAFFSRSGEGYKYRGGCHESKGWPNFLDEILMRCHIAPEAFNHCLAQKYEGSGGIGFHADDEECYPKGNGILTINVKGSCRFGVKSLVKKDVEFFLLNGPQILIMPLGMQESSLHSVKECSEGRVSLTFRSTNSEQWKNFGLRRRERLEQSLGEEELIEISIEEGCSEERWNERGEFQSLIDYLSDSFEMEVSELLRLLQKMSEPKLNFQDERVEIVEKAVNCEILSMLCKFMGIQRVNFTIIVQEMNFKLHLKCSRVAREIRFLSIDLEREIFKRVCPSNMCVVTAIGECLNRKAEEILGVLQRDEFELLLKEVSEGKGVMLADLEEIFRIFGIRGMIYRDSECFILNEGGTICGSFELREGHLEYSKKKKDPCAGILRKINTGKQFSKSVIESIERIASPVDYQVSHKRATLLADSLHGGSTGVILSALFNSEKNFKDLIREREERSVKILCVLGTFGCGKTHLFKTFIQKAKGKRFDLVTPRRALLEEIKKEVNFKDRPEHRRAHGQADWQLTTFEKFIKRAPFLVEGQVVFVDEIQLYPPGYLDLVLSLATKGIHWVVFGDPCQSEYHSEKDDIILSQIPSNVELLLKGKDYRFNILSRRFLNRMYVGRLPCRILEDGLKFEEDYLLRDGLESLSELEPRFKEAILVSSFEEKRIVEAYCPNTKKVLTFGESTGLTFNWGTVLVTLISERTNERRWLTALSRFRRNICIVNATGYSLNNLLTSYKERSLGKFLTGSSGEDVIKSMLSGNPKFESGFIESEVEALSSPNSSSSNSSEMNIDLEMRIGKDEGIREEKLSGDPWLKSMIDLFQIEDIQEVEVQEVEKAIVDFKVHLPREDLEGTRARWVHKILAKEFREFRIGTLVSTQFTDEHSKQVGAAQLTNAAERFESIYPRHKSNDTVTFLMAVKKRLRFSKPHIEKGKLLAAKGFGRFMLDQFLKKIPLKRNRDHVMFEKARQDFFDKKTSKSAATIENHNIRSCRDWLIDMTQIFSKSQLCTKFDNRFRVAKAAQTIVCFQHAVLCRFAPYMRYIEMKLKEALPKRYYIHSGKGLEELNDWVIKNQFDGTCTESDYEAFDASQDQYIVAFELELMKYLGLPNDLINDYEFIKLHLGSKLGSFAIMRFTGEASTFLFNTMANMLFTFLRYDIKGNESICFAGDDMCSSKRLTIKKEFDSFLSLIKLKAKVQHTKNPTFCGWHLCPDGIYKKPQLVFERMCIARETNNLHNCIDNYAIEVSFAYRKGEAIMARMDEEEVGAYYGCVRTIIKYKHLLKSDVKKLFESATM